MPSVSSARLGQLFVLVVVVVGFVGVGCIQLTTNYFKPPAWFQARIAERICVMCYA